MSRAGKAKVEEMKLAAEPSEFGAIEVSGIDGWKERLLTAYAMTRDWKQAYASVYGDDGKSPQARRNAVMELATSVEGLEFIHQVDERVAEATRLTLPTALDELKRVKQAAEDKGDLRLALDATKYMCKLSGLEKSRIEISAKSKGATVHAGALPEPGESADDMRNWSEERKKEYKDRTDKQVKAATAGIPLTAMKKG